VSCNVMFFELNLNFVSFKTLFCRWPLFLMHTFIISFFARKVVQLRMNCDRITEFSFIIFLDFIHFMKCFILSTMDYHLFFSSLPIIYCILLFVCQSLNNKLVRHTGQQSSTNE